MLKKKAAHRVSRKQHDVKNPSTPCFIQFNGLKWADLQISTTFSSFFSRSISVKQNSPDSFFTTTSFHSVIIELQLPTDANQNGDAIT